MKTRVLISEQTPLFECVKGGACGGARLRVGVRQRNFWSVAWLLDTEVLPRCQALMKRAALAPKLLAPERVLEFAGDPARTREEAAP